MNEFISFLIHNDSRTPSIGRIIAPVANSFHQTLKPI